MKNMKKLKFKIISPFVVRTFMLFMVKSICPFRAFRVFCGKKRISLFLCVSVVNFKDSAFRTGFLFEIFAFPDLLFRQKIIIFRQRTIRSMETSYTL